MEKKSNSFDWFSMSKVGLAGLLFVGFMGLGYTAYIIPDVTDKQQGIIMQVLTILGTVVSVVAYNMWPKGNDQDKATISALAEKVPPITGEAKESADADQYQLDHKTDQAKGGYHPEAVTYTLPDPDPEPGSDPRT